jgi:hypothetical protein
MPKPEQLPVHRHLSEVEDMALKALEQERFHRNTPEGRAHRAKMFEQMRVIRSIIEYGDEVELLKLEQAYLDPELDPEVKKLIELCWDKARYYRQRIVESNKVDHG